MKTVCVRLQDGQDLLAEIKSIAVRENILAGIILSGVGSLSESNIRLPVIKGKTSYINPKNSEIDSLHGTVSKNGCHIHIIVSDEKGKTFGGHLKEGCKVRTTCELVIGVLPNFEFKRKPDELTGFNELSIE
ncbi:MAG TPA: PPC domain-containing DNA-binding protein [Candidatus Saccharimonadales bacterium]|nr:PPC domain-containing DNA-binding protein [Candidatus Saccharimonadales bacterium]